MAIEKNNFKVSRVETECSPGSRKSMSSEEEELQRRSSAVESDDDDEFDDADSGAGSDDFDLLELGETGVEFCQVGNQTCSIPFELYDLQGLEDILSLNVWNECLAEEERFSLTKYLPDMDQETFMITMKELFTGSNFHFGSPVKTLFDLLKGGLCEPRVALYRDGWNFFQKRKHYHLLRKHQNTMVSNLCQIRDAWLNCRGYSIEERLRVLNIMKSQKSLMHEKMEDEETDSSGRDSDELLLSSVCKDKKIAQKLIRHSEYGMVQNSDTIPRGRSLTTEMKCGKQNPKGSSKLGGSKNLVPPVYHGLDMTSGPYSSPLAPPRHGKSTGYEVASALRIRDRERSCEDLEETYGMADSVNLLSVMDSSESSKLGRKHNPYRDDELASESLKGLPMLPKTGLHSYGRLRDANFISDSKVYSSKISNMKAPYNLPKEIGLKAKHLHRSPKGIRFDSSEHDEAFFGELPLRADNWSVRSKKWKAGRDSAEPSYDSYRASLSQMNDQLFPSEYIAKPVEEKFGGDNGGAIREYKGYDKNEETESESSDRSYGDEDCNPLLKSKVAYPTGVAEASPSSLKPGEGSKKAKLGKKDGKGKARVVDAKKTSWVVDNYSSKAKQKGKVREVSPLTESPARVLTLTESPAKVLEHSYVADDHVADNDNIYDLVTNGHFEEGKKKRGIIRDISGAQTHRVGDHIADGEEDSLKVQFLTDSKKQGRMKKKNQKSDNLESNEAPLLGCSSASKKRKLKKDITDPLKGDEANDLISNLEQPVENPSFSRKKAKKKVEADTGFREMETTSDLPVPDMVTADTELENKPQKKPFHLITPTVHTGFSFSIIHLLSAVRSAMVTQLSEDALLAGIVDEQKQKQEAGENGSLDGENTGEVCGPSLSIQGIVNRVRSNPGDPCILETQEPLQDLVRGVLKIFSSKTAPLGAKGWKSLAAYEKSTKSWSWLGPASHNSADNATVEEATHPEAWNLPHKMLVKLVDSFANWLKSGQETLQQIGSLPEPPLALMQLNLDEKERFRDLRAQKSLSTITPSSEGVREYFRKEEFLRYSIPDRAFSYTAADGKKSIVAPLRRCGGKPTSKARDHFMLKRDRPPHVTILCLVRDAAARLPGSIGTRADVCTLIRDSQYIVEDVSDAQVNQVVSGALDRLHYERDPCVQFDGERKLWVYLHREREEEDFEDDGTSSTKKWKRQKKDPAEPDDQATVTLAGFDLCSDVNAEPSCIDDHKGVDLGFDDNVDQSHGLEQSEAAQDPPMAWGGLDLNPVQENQFLCQENPTTEDFDDETFGRERPVGLLSAGLL